MQILGLNFSEELSLGLDKLSFRLGELSLGLDELPLGLDELSLGLDELFLGLDELSLGLDEPFFSLGLGDWKLAILVQSQEMISFLGQKARR